MTSPAIKVAIISPSMQVRGTVRALVAETNMATVMLELDEYCATFGDHSTQRIIEAQPQIILVDMTDPRAAIRALTILRQPQELRESWFFASAESAERETVIESVRAGARDFFPQPIQPGILVQAFARYLMEHRSDREIGNRKIYCIVGSKDGVGATTMAINTAVAMGTLPGTSVALIDLNSPVGDVAAYLTLKSDFTVADALTAPNKLEPGLLETFMDHDVHGISVLAGLKEYQSMPEVRPEDLSQMLQMMRQLYTHIFVDLPASMDQAYLQTLAEISTALLVVMTSELPALWRTDRLLRFLTSIGFADKIKVVINRETTNDDIDERAISRRLGKKVSWKLPNNYRAAIRAINTQKPLVTSTNSALVASYMKLARNLCGEISESRNEDRRRIFGLFPPFKKREGDKNG